MLHVILTYLIWLLYSFLEGVREANLKHHLDNSKSFVCVRSSYIFNTQRFLFIFLIFLFLLFSVKGILLLSVLSMILTFPFIQIGTYFVIRNKLNPNSFNDLSAHNTKIDKEKTSIYIDYPKRFRLFILGVVLQLFIFFMN